MASAAGDAGQPAQAQTAHPLRWSSQVHLTDLQALDKGFKQPIDAHGDALKCFEDPDKGQIVPCRTCEEYLEWKAAGNLPGDNHQIAVESWYKAACLPLKFLERAAPARTSFLDQIDLRRQALTLLPGSLNGLGDGTARRRVTKAGRGSVVWEDEGTEVYVDLLVWGDFNGDGIEDLLITVATFAKGGTFHSYDYYVVTKTSKEGKLRVLKPFE